MSHEVILQTTQEILERAGFEATVVWEEGTPTRLCIRSSENISSLIGTFDHLVRLVVYRRLRGQETGLPGLPNFVLDINDYRKAQSERLAELAHACAERVLESGHAESLSPMNAFERKVVHTELASYGGLETKSIGAEPNRRVVVKLANL